MNYDTAKQTLLTTFKTYWDSSSYSAIPVLWENGSLATEIPEFIEATVIFTKADQASMGTSPISRVTGYLYLVYHVMTGHGGSRVATQAQDALDALFKFKNLSGIIMLAPQPIKVTTFKGFDGIGLRCRFFFHSSS